MTMQKEIMPVGQNLMVQPYDVNPYMANKTEEGFKTDGSFINEDSGDKDQMTQDVICGKVVEVGHKCELVEEGDDIIFHIATSRPVPFMDKGFLLVPESNVFAVIGEGLKER